MGENISNLKYHYYCYYTRRKAGGESNILPLFFLNDINRFESKLQYFYIYMCVRIIMQCRYILLRVNGINLPSSTVDDTTGLISS